MLKPTLLLVLALFANLDIRSTELPPTGPRFDVRCELGVHSSGNDRLAAKEELRLLRQAIEDTYPRLPPELQEVAQRIVFVVSHREAVWTKRVFGWGPEDDAEYKYPDTGFFPDGTIKVSFTEKTIEALALGDRLSGYSPDIAEGAQMSARFVVAHELMHAFQYHRAPVRDVLALHRQKGSSVCKRGLLDKDLLADEQKRLDYERQAYSMHRRFIKRESMLTFADAVESYERMHQAEFSEAGPYHLLASSASSPFVGKLREEASMADKGGEFGPLAKFPNEGQLVPVQIVWTLKRINDSLAGSDDPLTLAKQERPTVAELRASWVVFMAGDAAGRVKSVLPCDPAELEMRYRAEVSRYEAIARH